MLKIFNTSFFLNVVLISVKGIIFFIVLYLFYCWLSLIMFCFVILGKIVLFFNEGVMSCFIFCSLRMRKKMFIVFVSVTYLCLLYMNSD